MGLLYAAPAGRLDCAPTIGEPTMARNLLHAGTEVVPFYVRAIRSGPLVFVSGTTSLDSKGRVQGKDAAEQTTITMRKVEAALKKAGCKLSDLTQMTIFVTDIRDMGAVSKALGKALKGSVVTSTLVAVSALAERARRARRGGRDRNHGRGRELKVQAINTAPADRGCDCG